MVDLLTICQDQLLCILKILFTFNTKQDSLMRKSTVLSLLSHNIDDILPFEQHPYLTPATLVINRNVKKT
jgi:hypothetical protein